MVSMYSKLSDNVFGLLYLSLELNLLPIYRIKKTDQGNQ